MIKEYTHIESKHYDKSAGGIDNCITYYQLSIEYTKNGLFRAAHNKWIAIVQNKISELKSGNLLDYGCGKGVQSIQYSSEDLKVFGIDISSKSIEIANEINNQLKKNATFEVMDCERTTFSDNFIDIIIDYGTFSSLDMNTALPELLRILKKEGSMISIETFGHNPFTNFKRWLNVILKKRTSWTANHIMKSGDWKIISGKFEFCETFYFGFWVMILAPFDKILPFKIYTSILKFLEKSDDLFFKLKFTRRLAFKTVVLLTKKKLI